MRYRLLALIFGLQLLMLLGSANALTIVQCKQLFQGGTNSYVGNLVNLTSYQSMMSIAVLIVIAIFFVLGITYAIGYSLHLDSLLNFTKAEMVEGVGNVAIIAMIGITTQFAGPAMYFFANFANLAPGILNSGIPNGPNAFYVQICQDINNNVISNSLENWFGVFDNLFITNILAAQTPPSGGFTVIIGCQPPDNFGICFDPFQGLNVLTQLLWDEQLAYFGSMFMGMFMIVMLFFIYFIFPIFLFVGIILRSFPWTRPAGGSLIALFIAFYIVFPAIMFPFVGISGGKGFCENQSVSSGSYQYLCNIPSFLTSIGDFFNLTDYNLGYLFYSDTVAFVQGIIFVGLDLVGLIIGLIISYEMVEKIGTVLGAPSLQGARMLGRVV